MFKYVDNIYVFLFHATRTKNAYKMHVTSYAIFTSRSAVQMDTLREVSSVYSSTIAKTIKTCTREAGSFVQAIGDMIDMEDMLKAIHKLR